MKNDRLVDVLMVLTLILILMSVSVVSLMFVQTERELDVCESGRAADKLRLEAAAVELEQCSQGVLQ